MDNSEFNWFRLAVAEGFGAKSCSLVYQAAKTLGIDLGSVFNFTEREFATALPVLGKGRYSSATFTNLINTNLGSIQTLYQKLKEKNISIISLDDPQYPVKVIKAMVDNAPPVLFCQGNTSLLSKKSIAVVGSRNIEDLDLVHVNEAVSELSREGYSIASGYAKGVDLAAHRSSLVSGGSTILVVSNGILEVNSQAIAVTRDWKDKSVFVSQFHPASRFKAHHAMIRNTLVCALSEAVVVMVSGPEVSEDGKQSGTFQAAKSALRMNIPLFVLSPKKLQSTSEGSKSLIKLGGIEFNNAGEILSHLSVRSQTV